MNLVMLLLCYMLFDGNCYRAPFLWGLFWILWYMYMHCHSMKDQLSLNKPFPSYLVPKRVRLRAVSLLLGNLSFGSFPRIFVQKRDCLRSKNESLGKNFHIEFYLIHENEPLRWNTFSYGWFRTKTNFDIEAKVDSEMDYFSFFFNTKENT